MPTLPSILRASLFFAVSTCVMTWPQVPLLNSHVARHADPYLSMWRLQWVHHALVSSPSRLFEANIFYPAHNSLAFSDATLLESFISAGLLALGAGNVAAYNLMVLLGLTASGIAMFVLACYVTGDAVAGLIAGFVFAYLPYRFEHFMHLELQWAFWMPLTLLCMHITVDRPSVRTAATTAVCLAAQFLSCIYYGLFLVVVAPLVGLVHLVGTADRARALKALALAAVIAAGLTFPYAIPYLKTAAVVDQRQPNEVAAYSATASSYLAAPEQNRLYGWTADRFGKPETRLFTGVVALVLGSIGAFAARRRILSYGYLIATITAVDLSLGTNGIPYPILYKYVAAFRLLRAPARFGILVACGLAVLVALGASRVLSWFAGRSRVMAASAIVLAMAAEYWSAPLILEKVQGVGRQDAPTVYQMLARLAYGPVLELPAPSRDRLPGYDPDFEYWSTTHWYPLVNGYSGHYPVEYLRTLETLKSFPDDVSLARLREIGTRYVIVHRALLEPEEFLSLLSQLNRRADVHFAGRYKDWVGDADLFELR